MKTEILKLLQENDQYVSGQKICENLGVSRTAVWKNIKSLQAEGYEIVAVPNKGYQLVNKPDCITREACQSMMESKVCGKNVVYFDETDSTNNVCKLLAEKGEKEGLLVVADRQTAGRGRRGHVWETPKGSAIAMSLLLRPKIEPNFASMLTLVSAIAMADSILECTGLPVKIKWPNDIVIGGKKICGILTEMSAEMACVNYVVVGIGVNVNTPDFPEDIKNVATSILIETGKQTQRSLIIARSMKAFETYYEKFLERQNLSLIKEDYEKYLVNKNEKVRVIEANGTGEETGTALGITETGELIVRLDDGKIRNVASGEVSVRGIYGYV